MPTGFGCECSICKDLFSWRDKALEFFVDCSQEAWEPRWLRREPSDPSIKLPDEMHSVRLIISFGARVNTDPRIHCWDFGRVWIWRDGEKLIIGWCERTVVSGNENVVFIADCYWCQSCRKIVTIAVKMVSRVFTGIADFSDIVFITWVVWVSARINFWENHCCVPIFVGIQLPRGFQSHSWEWQT